MTFSWQKGVGKNTSRWSYVAKSTAPTLMKQSCPGRLHTIPYDKIIRNCMELSGILTVQDWFPIPCYNVMNNNTQGWILYYQCNEKIVFQSVLTARKQQTSGFRSGQLKLSPNEGKPLKKANRVLPCDLTLRNMEGYQVLLRYYVFVIGIFTTLPSVSRGNTLNWVQAVYIFSRSGSFGKY